MSNLEQQEPLSIKEIQEGLKDRRLYVIKDEIGCSYPTLKALADGKPGNYTQKTLRAVSDYLRK